MGSHSTDNFGIPHVVCLHHYLHAWTLANFFAQLLFILFSKENFVFFCNNLLETENTFTFIDTTMLVFL